MSFPPRINYGINFGGNPEKKIWIPRIKCGAGLLSQE
jgi:hypothetical protein